MPKRRKTTKRKPKRTVIASPPAAKTQSKFKPLYVDQSRKLAQLGATDREMAEFFDIDVRTFHRWKIEYPGLTKALALGKQVADDRVERTLYQSALGYEYDAQKPFVDKDGGEHVVDYREFVKPDTVAGIFWMKNRRPDEWRDRQEHLLEIATTPEQLRAARERFRSQQPAIEHGRH